MAIHRIAVVGSGVAGLTAAHLLKKQHRVTVFEAASRLGGHTNTVQCDDGEGGVVGVDTGFIVCNDTTYPNFHKFLAELGVPWRFADMSVSVSNRSTGVEYCSRDLDAVFAQRQNLFSPKFLKMILDVTRFWRVAARDLAAGLSDTETLGAWLKRRRFSGAIVSDYLTPIAAAVWSSSATGILDFPVGTFLEFYRNHGFLRFYRQPRWQTVVGGSQKYIDAWTAQFPGDVALDAPVTEVKREAAGVSLFGPGGREYGEFDYVVVATHANHVLGVLGEGNIRADEREVFSAWRYHRNLAVLHEDPKMMPSERRAWGSWNYRKEIADSGSAPVSVTYDMNNLQGLTCNRRFFVTLNPTTELSREIARFDYEHPMYTVEAVQGRGKLAALQGRDRTFFCGSYHGYGFHEDAVKSGAAVAAQLGCLFD